MSHSAQSTLPCVTQRLVNSALCHKALSQLCTVSHRLSQLCSVTERSDNSTLCHAQLCTVSRTALHCVTQHSVNSALCHTALSQLCTVSHSAKFNSALCLREQRLLKPEMLNCICCRNMLYCLYFLVDDIIPTQTNQYSNSSWL